MKKLKSKKGFWVATDKDKLQYIYFKKPFRTKYTLRWDTGNSAECIFFYEKIIINQTWEDDPVWVSLEIKK